MGYYHSYLNSAREILDQYGEEKVGLQSRQPFSSFLKKYFAQHKKHGSNDRKQISHLCYCFFRLGKLSPDLSVEEKILAGLFLCSNKPNNILSELKPEWNAQVEQSAKEKLLTLDHSLRIDEIFPWRKELSNGIEYGQFCESFFIQPDLFLRLRPGSESIVKEKLLASGISFSQMNSACLRLPNNSKVENFIALDKEAVVQDYSSQQIKEYLKIAGENLRSPMSVWDCCAASGGKSLLLYDTNQKISLTVSDIRESILANLKKRFENAGIKKYKEFIAELAKPFSSQKLFDLIVCDAPCTGSGTWSRTPEQLYFFNEKKIEEYSSLQKKIVSNITPSLKQNGHLLYVTCSVFKSENEEVVNYVRNELDLELTKMETLIGYDKKADTMFAALFKKVL